MGGTGRHAAEAWRLARRQHGVITRKQLLALGYSRKAIEHRLADARLHRVHRGVFAVGRRELGQLGRWMAAVLACGPGAVLSHDSAAALWGLRAERPGPIHVSVPVSGPRRVRGIRVHRRRGLQEADTTRHHGIPVTSPICTLIDLAADSRHGLEAAINEADRLGLTDPEALRASLDAMSPRPGVGVLRDLLDRQTFSFTRSELERRFKKLAQEAGLPAPQTCVEVNGFEVDFYWPEIPLIVETDGLTYHRTPTQQRRDRIRDQAHATADVPHLRFTHAQIRDEPGYVKRTLAGTVARIRARAATR